MRGLTLFVGLVIGLAFVRATADIWALLLGAILLAALVRPAVDGLEHLRVPRGLSVTLVLVLLVFGVGLLASVVVLVAEQVTAFAKTLPDAAGGLTDWWNHLPSQLKQSNLPTWVVGTLEQAYGSLGQLIRSLADQLVLNLGTYVRTGLFPTLAGIAGGTVKLAAFVVIFVYCLADGPSIGKALVERISESRRIGIERVLGHLERSIMGYFRGQLIVALTMGLAVGIGLWLLGIPLAVPVALLVGVLELVPYLGVALGAVLVAFVALPLGWLAVLKALGVLVLAAQLEGHVLAPLIVGRSTKLHPLTVLLALLVGERLAGVGGMLVGIPVVAFAKLWLEDVWPTPQKSAE